MAKMGNAGASGGGMFAGLEPAQRAKIVQSILGNVTKSAGQSGSPLLAGLAPILAAMVGGRAQAKADAAGKEKRDSAGQAIFGDNAEARAMADLLAQDGLPDSYRRVGRRQLDDMLTSQGGTASPVGPAPAAESSAPSNQTVIDAATERGAIDTTRGVVLGESNGDLLIRSPDGTVTRAPASDFPGLSVGDPVGPSLTQAPDILTTMVPPPPPAAASGGAEIPLGRPESEGVLRLRYNPLTGEFE